MTKKAERSDGAVEPLKASISSPESESKQALRKKAEHIVQERVSPLPHDLEVLQDGFKATVHELQVHQIELEMQNEELHRIQAELEASRARYFDLYNRAPVGYLTLSQEGLILQANLTAVNLLGVTRDALVRHRLTLFVSPEDQDISYVNFKQLFEAGGLHVWEMRLVRNGAVPVWTRVEATRVEDSEGASVCRAVLSDITAPKRAQQELLQTHRKTTAILENMSDGFFTLDREWRFTYMNPAAAKMLGKTYEELLGGNFWEQWPNAAESPFGAAIRRAVAENAPAQVEAFYPEPLNARFELRCCPSPEGLSIFFSDITSRRRLEEVREKTLHELESALTEKTVLLKEVHHRVKNNLAVISSLLSMRADTTASIEAKAALGESRQRVHSMALIHEHLYGSSHLDRINFSDYAHELSEGLYSAMVTGPRRISLEMDVDPIEIGIEQAMPCALIVNELLTNAFKYAFPNGRTGKIRISFHESQPGFLELSIVDDGIGLPAGSLTEPNTKSLGIRIVRILTKQLDGSIEQAGPGTRILLRFMRVIGDNNTG